MLDAGCRMPDTGCQIPDARCQMPDTGYGYYMLDMGGYEVQNRVDG
jgi:hypothetical protein